MFRDVTTLMLQPEGFRKTIDELVQPYAGTKIDKVVGVEARGFILGGAVAYQPPVRGRAGGHFRRVSRAVLSAVLSCEKRPNPRRVETRAPRLIQ